MMPTQGRGPFPLGPTPNGLQPSAQPGPAPVPPIPSAPPAGFVPTAQPPVSAPAAPIPPIAQPDVEPRQPQLRLFDLPVASTHDLPGAEVENTLGLVLGVVTRPRDLAHHPEMAFIHTSARQDAVAAMVAQAVELGADAVVGVAFDGGKVSDGVSEVTAYGTAVSLRH